MKTKLLLCAFLLCFFAPQITKAQFQFNTGNYGQTTTAIRGIGIGDFSTAGVTSTSARLHINNFFCNLPTGALNGLLFRTDGSNAVENRWQLYTGATNAALTEKFRLYVPASSDNVFLRSTVDGANMQFQTSVLGTGFTRMVITDGLDGFVGIGNSFTAPQSQLHLNDGPNATYYQVTNTATNVAQFTPATTEGLKLGIAANGAAEIRQQETNHIQFFTGNNHAPSGAITHGERMRIVGIENLNLHVANASTTYPVRVGNVGINVPEPSTMLQLGTGNVTNNGGYRDWMYIGAYVQNNSDNMYFGYNDNTGDAVINWGNNPTNDGTDRLVFNFTAIAGGGFQASGSPGLEASRWVTDGNRMFIGFGGDPNNAGQNPYSANPDPGNTVEINSSAFTSLAGTSGLRFTDLRSTSNTIANPGSGVLSVNTSGDVIYVPSPTGIGTCANPTVLGAGVHGAINLNNNNNFYFLGNGAGNAVNNVVIGKTCVTPVAKLDVLQSAGNASSIATKILSTDSDAHGLVVQTKASQNTIIVPPASYDGGTILRNRVTIGSNVGPFTGTNGIAGALLIVGNMGDGTNCLSNQWAIFSDSILKENVYELENSLEVVKNLRGVSFDWTESGIHSIGFIAQEVEDYLPEVVNTDDETGIKNIDYDRIIPIAVDAIKELDNSVWKQTGNSGTIDGVNFIGTTDNSPLNLRVNNQKAGRIDHNLNNTFLGYKSGNSNTSGVSNTAIGEKSLELNTYGEKNTAIGRNALGANVSGKKNTALGYAAFNNGASYENSTALGFSANITASDQVRIGNSSVGSIGGFSSWTNVSDSRFKKSVNEKVPGLDFITKLRPVTYQLDMNNIAKFLNTPDSLRSFDSESKKSAELQTGFIAQEVEKAANEIGYSFSGVDKPENENDYYGLRYAEFTVPLVKAVQELNEQNTELKKLVEEQQKQINEMRGDLTVCCNSDNLRSETTNNLLNGGTISVQQIEAIAQDLPLLSQNQPNPFSEKTVIRFYLPKGTKGASIKVFDNAGAVYRLFALTGEGPGIIEIEANSLAAGTYYYSLLLENNVIDTKTMMITK